MDAFDKPYYSQVGYYAMYLMPPGTQAPVSAISWKPASRRTMSPS